MANKGLIRVYTGDGEGKTTATLGLAMRAARQGMKVVVIQFTKGIATGEHRFIAKYHPFDIVQISVGDSLSKSTEQLRQEAQQTLERAEQEMLMIKHPYTKGVEARQGIEY